jgi:hypothetical protein
MRADESTRSWLRPRRPPADGRRFEIDPVSDDIRKLERYFLNSDLRTPLQIEFHESGIIPDRGDDTDGDGPIHQVVELVAWEPIGDEASWHLTYRKMKWIGTMPPLGGMDGPTFDRSVDLEHCPLVEASPEDRIRAHRALPELLQEAGTMARRASEEA